MAYLTKIAKMASEHASKTGRNPTHIYMTARALLELLNEMLKLSDSKSVMGMEILVVDELPANAEPDADFVVCS
jgi:hypothetical protein